MGDRRGDLQLSPTENKLSPGCDCDNENTEMLHEYEAGTSEVRVHLQNDCDVFGASGSNCGFRLGVGSGVCITDSL